MTPTYIHDGCGGVHPPGTPCGTPAEEEMEQMTTCPACGGTVAWHDEAWVCNECGDEWYPDEAAKHPQGDDTNTAVDEPAFDDALRAAARTTTSPRTPTSSSIHVDRQTVPIAAYERVRTERDKAQRDLSAAKRRNRNLLDNLRAATLGSGVPVGDDTPTPTTWRWCEHEAAGGGHCTRRAGHRNTDDPASHNWCYCDENPCATLALAGVTAPVPVGDDTPTTDPLDLRRNRPRLCDPILTAGRWVEDDGTVWFEVSHESLEPWEALLPGTVDGQLAQKHFTAAYDDLVDLVRRAGAAPDLTALLDALDAYEAKHAAGNWDEHLFNLLTEVRAVADLVREDTDDGR